MSGTPIPIELKQKCVEMVQSGMTAREAYKVFAAEHPQMNYQTFKVKIHHWRRGAMADSKTLCAGTFGNFTAHNATVQVDGDGNIRQAWIKQGSDGICTEDILEAIKTEVLPIEIVPPKGEPERAMLEIPLFDMHFGIARLHTYAETLTNLITAIRAKHYDEINIVFGQDMLHTNDMRGHTVKGTAIDRIDFPQAWSDASSFWHTVFREALAHASTVNAIYSAGNHDECTSWCLFKALEAAFPQAEFDDEIKPRKVISWRRCFIGITHGDGAKSAPHDLRGQFSIGFPLEFANADVREIHAGHLHHEKEADIYGVMLRRTSTATPTTDWGENEGFTGAIKRFALFEWTPGKLKTIHYI